MLAGTAAGNMLPAFIIIKCYQERSKSDTTMSSAKKKSPHDWTTSRVLTNLLNGDLKNRGWEHKEWSKILTLKFGKEDKTYQYKRPYLFHSHTGTVITVHTNAWMDSVGLCMYAELVVKPWADKDKRKKLLVWDNCPSHNAEDVIKVFAECGIRCVNLPRYMTDRLQVMDLVVNGPLKTHFRSLRAKKLYDYMQSYKSSFDLAKVKGSPLPKFSPTSPKTAEGIDMIMDVLGSEFTKDKFKDSLKKTFVDVGLSKRENGSYKEYPGHSATASYASLVRFTTEFSPATMDHGLSWQPCLGFFLKSL